jgi:HD superfamily phosphohydrolase
MISKSIIGLQIDDRVPLLHEIISGPFDADKLDYFVRDARLAGIPSVFDITRLVQKLAIRDLTSAELPREIASCVQTTEENHFIFGVKWSGAALLDELQLARVYGDTIWKIEPRLWRE